MDPEPRFRALFLRAYPALGRYAHYRGLSQSDAEDLVSSTLEVAWRKLDQVPFGWTIIASQKLMWLTADEKGPIPQP